MDNKNFWLYLTSALIAGILIGGGVVYFINGGTGGSGMISMYPPKSSPDWLAKVDDYVITTNDFETGFRALLAQIPEDKKANLPPDMKNQYFESLLKEYILSIKALNEGIQKKPENDAMLKSYIRRFLSNLYLQMNAPVDKSQFIPSKADIDNFYSQHKPELDRSGMKSDQLKQVIVQELERQKEQAWIEELVNNIKISIKVEKNNEALLKEGISSQQMNKPLLSLPLTPGSSNK